MITKRMAFGCLILAISLSTALAQRKIVEYDLVVKDTIVNYSGKNKKAIAINGQIPGPVLHFTEGDSAIIRVHNRTHHETTMHWHGLILPVEQDGVPFLTTAPTYSGQSHTYTFPIVQNGTYFYHSHSGTQQQSGVYGAFVIEKKKDDPTMRDEDKLPTHAVLLSDWTDVDPHEVMRRLKTGSDWSNIKKKSTQSYLEAAQAGHLGTKFTNEWKRMAAMDISDVHYDQFLMNGKETIDLSLYKAGDNVRLRVINGSSSTNFWLRYAGAKMKVLASDGKDVVPVAVDRILIAVSETYDIEIMIPENGKSYEFSATSEDRTGSSRLWLGQGNKVALEPLRSLKYFEGMKSMNNMMDMKGSMKPMGMDMSLQKMDMNTVMYPEVDSAHSQHGGDAIDKHEDSMHINHKHDAIVNTDSAHVHDMHNHDMQKVQHSHGTDDIHSKHVMPADAEGLITLNYGMLKSPVKTVLPTDRPVRELYFELTGNMERYVWSIDNKTVSEEDEILIKDGENVRIILYNNTMMRHPMHLHGHFFRVVNEHGDYSPLKTVLDIMPMETDTIEFNASERTGDWFFHCHILYHMMSGMGKIFSYENSLPNSQIPNKAEALKKMYAEDRMFYLAARNDFSFNGNVGKFDYTNTRWAIQGEWELGYKAKHGYELNVRAGRYIGRMQWLMPYVGIEWSYIEGIHGKNMFGQNPNNHRWSGIAGIRYTLPWFVVADARVDMYGKARLQLEREDIALTGRLRMNLMGNTDKEYRVGFNYILTPYLGLTASYGSEMKWGAGIQIAY